MSNFVTLEEIRKMKGSELRIAAYENYYRKLGYDEADAKDRAYQEFFDHDVPAARRTGELIGKFIGSVLTLAIYGAIFYGVYYYFTSAS